MVKSELRKIVRERIRNLETREKEDEHIVSEIRKMKEYRDAKVVLAYSPIEDEVDITPLFKDDKIFLFPYTEGMEMYFALPPLRIGMLGILEPVLKSPYYYEKAFMITPSRALSRENDRLGRGKGYYDRYIKANGRRLFTCGIAYSVQIFDSIPTDKSDIKLDSIISL